MSSPDLQKELGELKSELFKLRFSLATNGLDNPMKIKEVKKDIAKIKTVLTERELEESKKAMEALGLEYIEKIDIKLPEIDLDHNILVFKKVKNTPSKYPRKAGKVTKNPIK